MAENITRVPSPDITTKINQEFFIEELGGPQHPITILERFFPESIYSHDVNSNLAALLYALVGPAGIGWLRQNYLLARLEFEAAGLSTQNLTEMYLNPFEFARRAQEAYEFIPEGLLTATQWEKIQKSDSEFRNRAVDFLKGANAGGTLKGLTLVTESGLAHPVELIENYQFLFDNHSDHELHLKYFGNTTATEEVIIVPHQNSPTTCVQTLAFVEEPREGEVELSLPMGEKPESEKVTFKLKRRTAKEIEEIKKGEKAGEIKEQILPQDIQRELESLKMVGSGNVYVTGPVVTESNLKMLETFTIYFTGALAEKELPQLIVHGKELKDKSGIPIVSLFYPKTEIVQNGSGIDGEETEISPANWYYANIADNQIKPVTTIMTPLKGRGITKRQSFSVFYPDSKFTQVVRYVIGLSKVPWPETNQTEWIRAGVEKEAPITQYGEKQHYSNFHNIAEATSYNSTALADPTYESSSWPLVRPSYRNERSGEFSPYEVGLYPFLGDYKESSFTFSPSLSVADPPNLRSVEHLSEEANLVEGIYPTTYLNLPHISIIKNNKNFWASEPKAEGTDILEIDLGAAQAVNAIYFQATNKPYNISIDYDLLDNGAERKFVPVTFNVIHMSPTLTLRYKAHGGSWTTCKYSITNSLEQMIYTRYIRIKFERVPGAPLILSNGTLVPYGVEIKNLRIGRVLA